MTQIKRDEWEFGIDIRGRKVPRWLIGLMLFLPGVFILEVVGGLVLLALLGGVSPDQIGKIFSVLGNMVP